MTHRFNASRWGFIAGLYLFALFMAAPARADQPWRSLKLEHPQRGFISVDPIKRWEDGLIVGNGTEGVLISGTPVRQSYSIGHEWLFDPRTPRKPLVRLGNHMDQFRQWSLAGEGDKAKMQVVEEGRKMGLPDILWTNPMVPAGSLQVWSTDDAKVTGSARSVDWQRGLATIARRQGDAITHSQCFASRSDQLIAVRLTCPGDGKINAKLKLARLINPEKVAQDSKPDDAITASPDWLSLEKNHQLQDPWPEAVNGYTIVARLIRSGGSAKVVGGWTHITDADALTVLIRIELYKGKPFDAKGVERIKTRLGKVTMGFDELLGRHAEAHGRLFNRVRLRLGEQSHEPISSEALLAGSKMGATAPRKVQRLFDAARYALISSTGSLPPTLQGIWSGTFKPNWSSDFTQDGNVQAVIDSGLCGNFPEVTRAYLEYMSSFHDHFRRNAQQIYGYRGVWVPARTSDHGDFMHFSRTWPGQFWFAGAAWVSAYYHDYWLYTADRAFFDQHAVPFMLDAAAFYEDYLCIEREGKLVFAPSFSPEVGPVGKNRVTVNATMTVAAVRQLLRNLLALHETGVTQFNDQRVAKWKAMLARMPDYMIAEDGAFKEWLWPGLDNSDRHRHASHLYPAWFEVDPALRNSARLRQAMSKAIDNRLNYRRDRKGGDMAFGLVQKGIAAAHIRDEKLAYECVEWMVNSFWTTGLCSTHDPGKIFNCDISGGMPGVIIELLMQSRSIPAASGWSYEIDLLPALPGPWPDGSITGIRARGGFEIDLTWKNGKPVHVLIRSLNGNPCTVRYSQKSVTVETETGKAYELAGRLTR